MFSLELPYRGDFNEYTQYTISNIKKITLHYPKSTDVGVFQETQERARNSRGKRAISVRATEGLLYMKMYLCTLIKVIVCAAQSSRFIRRSI